MDMLAMDQPTSMLSSSKSLTSLGDSANAEDMNRQDIASGAVAPIVARESVFKYQMALKEEQVKHMSLMWTFHALLILWKEIWDCPAWRETFL